MVIDQRHRVADHAVHFEIGVFGRRSAREVEQRVHDLTGAERLFGNLVEQRRLLIVAVHLLGEHLRVGRDHRERRIHLVGDARGQQADRAELIGLDELALEFRPVGDVVENDEAPDLLLVARNEWRDGDVHDRLAHRQSGRQTVAAVAIAVGCGLVR